MSESEIQRTIRRCTAIIVILLSSFVLLFQGYLEYQGIENNLRNIWPIARYLSFGALAGGLLYLLSSAGRSLFDSGT